MRVIKTLIILIAGVLLTSCVDSGSVQIMSLETGKTVTLKREFCAARMSLLSVFMDDFKPVLNVITMDEQGKIFIIKYDMNGNKLKTDELPFYVVGLLSEPLVEQCIFIQEQSKLLYLVEHYDEKSIGRSDSREDTIYSYIIGAKVPVKLVSFNADEYVVKIKLVSSEAMIVHTRNDSENSSIFYAIEIATGKMLSKVSSAYPSECLCVDSENKTMLLRESSEHGGYILNTYDILTGKIRDQIANVDVGDCSNAFFYKDQIIYEGLNDIFIVDANGRTKPSILLSYKSKKNKIYITDLNFIPDNKMFYCVSDDSFFSNCDFIIFNILEQKEIKRIKAPFYTENLHVFDNYIVWDN